MYKRLYKFFEDDDRRSWPDPNARGDCFSTAAAQRLPPQTEEQNANNLVADPFPDSEAESLKDLHL